MSAPHQVGHRRAGRALEGFDRKPHRRARRLDGAHRQSVGVEHRVEDAADTLDGILRVEDCLPGAPEVCAGDFAGALPQRQACTNALRREPYERHGSDNLESSGRCSLPWGHRVPLSQGVHNRHESEGHLR